MSVIEAIEKCDLLVVGAGLFGLTVAERAASAEYRVVIVDSRAEIGGNAASYFDSTTNIEVHKYGSHLFHTSNEKVWNYVRRFGAFTNYRHTVYTKHKGRTFSLPINLATLESFFDRALNPESAKKLLESLQGKESSGRPESLEERAISLVGRDLYKAFIEGYTAKQWQTDPRELPAEIINRLPVRLSYDNRYFSDTWEGLPEKGYSAWMRELITDPKIAVFTGVDYFDLRQRVPAGLSTVYTGPLDRYFDYKHGALSWRTLDFEFEVVPVADFQGTSVMNYADRDVPYTRIHEFKHLHPERDYLEEATVIAREYSRMAGKEDEPYYPVNSASDRETLLSYRRDAAAEADVFFGGRLGSYLYLDMHMAIASALSMFENKLEPHLRSKSLKR